jgi:hypothetical protein
MASIRVFWSGSTVIDGADNEAHAEQLFREQLRHHVTNDVVAVEDFQWLEPDRPEPELRETLIRLGLSR